jgi:dihydrofolate synthase/folylpolyglutamate synthase
MSAEAAVNRLLAIHPKGFDLSLDRVLGLLDKLGNPHLKIPPVFHVAGTNGKGSTTAFLRAILEAANKTVHVHTSPHLVNWHERYRLGDSAGGKFVSDHVLEQAIIRAETANGGKPITVFEIMSAVGFLLFSEYPADYCVIEVGLGGRFDATNVLQNPAACLITPVGLDHEAYLGNTLSKIAFEKAGIIKPSAPVFVGLQDDEALTVIEQKAANCRSAIKVARQDFDFYKQAGRFVFQDDMGLLDLPMPRLLGDHQLANAALAIAACRAVLPNLLESVYEIAMETVSWPGRFERLSEGKLQQYLPPKNNIRVWIDGGHNPHAGKAISDELRKPEYDDQGPLTMIVGMLTTKEPDGFFKNFSGLAERVIAIPVSQSEAGFDPAVLASAAEKAGLVANTASSIEKALGMINSNDNSVSQRVLICGSLYLVGEVLQKNETPPV